MSSVQLIDSSGELAVQNVKQITPELTNNGDNVSEEHVPHWLETPWCLWLYTNNKQKSWDENLQPIFNFDSVELFWAVFNRIQSASRLPPGHDFALFRTGTKPAWEDEANKDGGRWIVSLNSKQYRQKFLDKAWLETILLMIGEDFNNAKDESKLIIGAVVSVRFKDDRIALWTANAEDTEVQKSIGRQLKERLGLQDDHKIAYEVHKDQSGPKSKRGPRFHV